MRLNTRHFTAAIARTAAVVVAFVIAFQAEAKKPHPLPAPTTAPIVRGPRFIIGVCQQPASSVKDWMALGVNTFVDVPQGNDPVKWRDAIVAAGGWEIRAPIGDPAEDVKDTHLIAWSHHDEPDLNRIPTEAIEADKERTKAIGLPWFMNVDGSRVLGIQDTLSKDYYQRLFNSADWLCSDVYPVSGWNLNVPLETPGQATDRLIEWSGGKPRLQYVEFGYQGNTWLTDPWLAPTVAQWKLQVRQAIARHCKGIILFPLQVGSGFKWDVSTPELKVALTEFSDVVNGGNPAAGLGK